MLAREMLGKDVVDAEDLWRIVTEERDAIASFPADRGWDVAALYAPNRAGKRMPMKVIGTGLPRTGTLSQKASTNTSTSPLVCRQTDLVQPHVVSERRRLRQTPGDDL